MWALVVFFLGFGGGILIFLAMERVRKAQWRVIERQIAELSPLVEKTAYQNAESKCAEVRDFEFRIYDWIPPFWQWWQGQVGQSRKYRFKIELNLNIRDVRDHDKEPTISEYVVSRVAYRPHVPSLSLPEDESWWLNAWDGPFESSEEIRTGDLAAMSLLAALMKVEESILGADGDVWDASGAKVGKVWSDGDVWNLHAVRTGKVWSDGDVWSASGAKVGKVWSDGHIWDTSGTQLGTVWIDGDIWDVSGTRVGKVWHTPLIQAGGAALLLLLNLKQSGE